MIVRRLIPIMLFLGLALFATASFAHAAAPAAQVAAPAAKECEKAGQCQVPEAPLPIGLPLVGLAVFGGYVLLVRRTAALPSPARP